MCLIVFDWRPRETDGPLFTLVANRDEFFRREAEPLHWWKDEPGLLAGRDLVGGGTWLGLTRDGRFAALTNYRAPDETRADAPTRGTLVSDWLAGEPGATPLEYLHRVARDGDRYNGFNLLVGDWTRRELGWYCNRSNRGNRAGSPELLAGGTHGISNAVLDTPWPKLVCKRATLARELANDPAVPLETLVEMMRDPQPACDDELPATGIPLERERALSAAFIETPGYGTRSTTALRVSARGARRFAIDVIERSDDDGSHRIERPGHFERREAFEVVPR
ncbi:NRDE family protein [Burkholderia sp. WAC0059]|uniref:NRDE family protein n=1 Tax=Burkholderia sp. WAC0059 TaxID=2066022 RepID=UPI000C7F215D|nr:NRDE family protein [Burkholderia sp. WAC0059]PLZ03720.1 NRDE family protein [Burkholderia sp. WAC0059]